MYIMKISQRKIKLVSVFVSLIFLFVTQAQSQEKKSVNLNDIALKLTFTSRISKSTEEINKELIADVRKRGVNFILEAEDEKLLQSKGANDFLIKAIRESLPKGQREKIILYKKYVDNYKGTFEQKKIALKTAKEYLEKYKDCAEDKHIIEYFKKSIPMLEQQTTITTQKQF